MRQLEQGVVLHFNEDGGFGFIGVEGGPDVFFHANDGQFFAVADRPQFIGETRRIGGRVECLPRPAKGNTVLFFRSQARNGRPKASPWGFAWQLAEAQQTYASLPAYRVVEEMTDRTGCLLPSQQPVVTARILWEGRDLLALRARYPRLDNGERDTFSHCSASQDGRRTYRRWFERMKGERWVPCDDPRVGDPEAPRQ